MTRAELAGFVLLKVREKWEREVARETAATAAASSPVVADEQVTQIKEFLAGSPFGCHTEKARKFAELVSGKKIDREREGESTRNRVGRLRVRVLTGDNNGHCLPIGATVLSLSREGLCVHLREGRFSTRALPVIERTDTRKPTAAEVNTFLAAASTPENLATLGNLIVNSVTLSNLCEKV